MIIVDKDLEGVKAESICSEIKREYSDLSLILLVNDFEVEKITHLYRVGVDDFISKPIDIDKFISRISIHLTTRRTKKNVLQVNGLKINLENMTVHLDGELIDLTPQEFKLLKFLVRNKGRVLSRDMILSRVWSYQTDIETRAVDVYIGYLRNKIDKNRKKKLIKTIRGFGYMIKDE